MTPEQKLNYLREWMAYFIDFRCEERRCIDIIFETFYKFGILQYSPLPDLITFDQYIQSIENEHN